MKRAVLFLNGELRDYAFCKSQLRAEDYIVAVDGGGHHCQMLQLQPDLAIGDFDSLSLSLQAYYRRQKVEMLTFPADKDAIDAALAIDEMIARGAEEIVLFAALGGKRSDMALANVMLLSSYDHPVSIVDRYCEITCLRPGEHRTIANKRGWYLSWISLSDQVVTGISTGLRYPLEDLCFQRGESRSLSNEIEAEEASVCLEQGIALLILQEK